jgi:hypothetical protein
LATEFQLVVDCTDPARLVPFWMAALHYAVEPPPGGAATWNDYWRSIGIPEDELDQTGDGSDSIVDPEGVGPRIWFQPVPEPKNGKNRLHLDLRVGGPRTVPLEERTRRVQAEVARLEDLGARQLYTLSTEGANHFGIVLADPEGNEFCVV